MNKSVIINWAPFPQLLCENPYLLRLAGVVTPSPLSSGELLACQTLDERLSNAVVIYCPRVFADLFSFLCLFLRSMLW